MKEEYVLEKKIKSSVLYITQSAATAAIYVVLTVLFQPVSFGAVQLRVSEMLIVLPMFTSAAVPGLFIGCFFANILGGAVFWDVVFGSMATLIGAYFSYMLRNNRWLVPIPAVLSNALTVPFILKFAYGVDVPLPLLILYITAGEFISCYICGEILISAIQKHSNIFSPTQGTDNENNKNEE